MNDLFWSIASGLGTSLGALILLVWKTPSESKFFYALSGSAGIMLAATVLGLLPASFDYNHFAQTIAGIIFGVIVMAALDKYVPHIHATFVENKKTDASKVHTSLLAKSSVLIITAITLHNIPEGIAVGFALQEPESNLGVSLAGAILIHNIPEGLAVALPLLASKMSFAKVFMWTSLTGILEILGALAAYALGTALEPVLAGMLAFAAGAMLYVVVDEMIPAAHIEGETKSSLSFLAAFVFMTTIMHFLG